MKYLKSIFNCLLLLLILGTSVFGATSVTHNGPIGNITWTWSENRTTGTFANGEPWVVGPITLTAISRSTGGDSSWNGSMKNPVPESTQGFNVYASGSTTNTYDAAKNIAENLPSSLVAGDSIVSSIGGSYPNVVAWTATLTVVSTAPAAGSFRPQPYGAGPHNVVHNKSQINYSLLESYQAPASAPSKSQVEAWLPSGTWMEWGGSWLNNQIGPSPIMNVWAGGSGPSNYGREIAWKWGHVGLWLQLNYSNTDKETAAIRTIQAGIDIAGYLANGGNFYHDGGHKCGRKLPVLLAGLLLNNSAIKTIASNPDWFQEDQQTFIIQQSDVGRSVVSPKQTYQQGDVGRAEWGVRHRWEPNQDDRRWHTDVPSLGVTGGGSPYRGVVWPSQIGAVLAADLMNQESAWNHSAIFAYTELWVSLFGTQNSFYGDMWTYKTGGNPTTQVHPVTYSPNGGAYETDQYVALASATSGASIRYNLTTDGSVPANPSSSSGTVYSSPVFVSSAYDTVRIKAIAYKSGMTDSAVTSADYSFVNCGGISASSHDGNVPCNTVDGNLNTRWSAQGNGQWIEYELDSITPVSGLRVAFFNGNARVSYFDIEVSTDGNSWTNAYSGQSSGSTLQLETYTFAQTSALYVRYVGYGNSVNDWNSLTEVEIVTSGGGQAEAPIFSPGAGTYTSVQSVTMSSATSGASIRYTTDGTTPTSSSGTVYSGPVTIGSSATLKAISYKSGLSDSAVTSGVYTIEIPQVSAPGFSPAGGSYSSAQSVTISSATSGATIRYTTDGSTPTSGSGTVYSGPVTIGSSVTLKAIAYKSGMSDSSVSSAAYTITIPQVGAPNFSPGSGTYSSAQSVTISSATSGATIRYTTDGSTPTSGSGTVYSAPVTIGSNMTLKAIAYKSGMIDSSVTTADYVINIPQVSAPSFSPAGGTYSSAQSVTMSSATSGATIRYTTDGSTPTSSSGTVYSGAVAVGSSATLKAIAYKSGMTDSSVSSAAYVINSPSSGIVAMDLSNGYNADLIATTGEIAYATSHGTTSQRQVNSHLGDHDFTGSSGSYAYQSFVDQATATASGGSDPTGIPSDGAMSVDSWDYQLSTDFGDTTSSTLESKGYNAIKLFSNNSTESVTVNLESAQQAAYSAMNMIFTQNRYIGNGGSHRTWITVAYTDSSTETIYDTGTFYPSGANQPGGTIGGASVNGSGGFHSGSDYLSSETSLALSASRSMVTTGSSPNYNSTVSTSGRYLWALADPLELDDTKTLASITFNVTGSGSSRFNHLAVFAVSLETAGGGQVAAPNFSPAGGTYSSAQSVTISSATSGATIRYTTDGSTPTSSSGTVYSGAVSIGSSATLKAIAYKSGMTDSSVTSEIYTINIPHAAAPGFSPAGGTYTSELSVTISSVTSGATIRYTTDGSTPTSGTGTVYTGPVAVDSSSTLKAIAYKSGLTDSSVSSAAYVINIPQVEAPTFSPAAGTYTSAQSVTMSSATSGATIRYTTDGSTPTSSSGTVYSGAVAVGSSATLKAIAYKSGMTDSSVSSAAYVINSPSSGIVAMDLSNGYNADLIATTGEIAYATSHGSSSQRQVRNHLGDHDFTGSSGVYAYQAYVDQATATASGGSAPTGIPNDGALSVDSWDYQLSTDFGDTTSSTLESKGYNAIKLFANDSTESVTVNVESAQQAAYSAMNLIFTQNRYIGNGGSHRTWITVAYTDSSTETIYDSGTFYPSGANQPGGTIGGASVNGSGGFHSGSDYLSSETSLALSTSRCLATTGSSPNYNSIVSTSGRYLWALADPLELDDTKTLASITFNVTGSGSSRFNHLAVFAVSLETAGSQVAAPSFSPAGGTYSSAQSVTMSSATSGATIRYTTDGSTPTSSSGTVYSGAVSIGSSATLKAIAYKSGMTDSSVTSEGYTINLPQVAAPGFSPAGGTYTSVQSVTISSATSGATIRYTTDGSTPTSGSGTVYSGAVTVDSSATLKAIAYKSGMTDSSVTSETYTINLPQVEAPGFSPTGGTYTSVQSVTMSSATSGATIRYTTNGSTPTSSSGTVYSGAVTIDSSATLKAIAYKSGMTDSSVTSAAYVMNIPQAAAPGFSPAAGTYTSAQSVTISSATSGATIRYTTDGSAPSSISGTVYSGPVTVDSSMTLKAIAYKSGMTDSAVGSASYVINIAASVVVPMDMSNGYNADLIATSGEIAYAISHGTTSQRQVNSHLGDHDFTFSGGGASQGLVDQATAAASSGSEPIGFPSDGILSVGEWNYQMSTDFGNTTATTLASKGYNAVKLFATNSSVSATVTLDSAQQAPYSAMNLIFTQHRFIGSGGSHRTWIEATYADSSTETIYDSGTFYPSSVNQPGGTIGGAGVNGSGGLYYNNDYLSSETELAFEMTHGMTTTGGSPTYNSVAGEFGRYLWALRDPLVLNEDKTLVSITFNVTGSGPGRFNQLAIFGISLLATPEIVNVVASSDDGNVPMNTLDGNLGTMWSALGSGEWIEYELNTVYQVSGVNIAFYLGDSLAHYFDLQVSIDGFNWTTVISNGVTSGSTSGLEEFSFAATNARYIRYVGDGNSFDWWNKLTEVEILIEP